jgi:hypothetical protein
MYRRFTRHRRRILHIPWLHHREQKHEEAVMMAILTNRNIGNVQDDGYHFVCKGKLILFYCNPVVELLAFISMSFIRIIS